MKTAGFIFAATVVLANLTISATAMALSGPENSIETNQLQENQIQYNQDQANQPEKKVTGEVSYISGGIGQDEARELKLLAKNYAIEVVFVQKTNRVEEYLAEVKLQIKDAKGNVVLDITTDGPILLANLRSGKYVISAEYNNTVKTNRVRIDAKKHQKIVFWWPI